MYKTAAEHLRQFWEKKLKTNTKQIALRDFKRMIGKQGFKGKYLAIHLNEIIRNWLALPARRDMYEIDCSPPHEVYELIKFIENDFRSRWREGGRRTKRINTRRKEEQTEAARQLKLI